MRLILLIITVLITGSCFGQTIKKDVPKVDSMDIKIISMKDMTGYLNRINLAIMKQFDLTQQAKYNEILKELQAVMSEAEKKRKSIK